MIEVHLLAGEVANHAAPSKEEVGLVVTVVVRDMLALDMLEGIGGSMTAEARP